MDAATSLGMLPADNFLTCLAARAESWLLYCFDRVSTISEQMLVRLKQKGASVSQAVLFPNWVNTNEIYPLSSPQDSLRETLGIPATDTVILYSGNMGEKQGLETLILVARELQINRNLHFILCGEGSARVYWAGIGCSEFAEYRIPAFATLREIKSALEHSRCSYSPSESRMLPIL